MITIALADEAWEYGVRALLMSFFPHQEFKVEIVEDAKPLEKDRLNRLQIYGYHHRGSDYPNEMIVSFYDEAGKEYSESKEVVLIPGHDRTKDIKNAMDIAMYHVLSQATGKTLPWGILSGIRPTKLPMAMLEEGMEDQAILERLQERHLVSKRKSQVSLNIAKLEKSLLDRLDMENGYSLYVGIPFCPSTCLYCSFTSYPIGMWRKRVDEYLDALEYELKESAKIFAGKTLNTIYVGGGTPTSLDEFQLDRLCTMIETYFDLSHILEYTVEAGRPDSITMEKLLALKKHRVDRISVNPQTMKQSTLELIGRHHTVDQTIAAYKLAREAGFTNINMDLIFGLPMESDQDIANTLQKMIELDPDNLTVHSLAIKRAARLNMNWDQYADMTITNSDATMEAAYTAAQTMGMQPYYLYRQKNMAGNFENVGFAKPGKEGLYNILIMEEKQTILACGAGASTKLVYQDEANKGRIERVENVKDVANYIDRIEEMVERKMNRLGTVPK